MYKLYIILLIVVTCFQSKPSLAAILNVPVVYPDIQAGIDASLTGDTVLVADGIYTGPGNQDIDFTGKDIVLLSMNGPQNTIIDCEGSSINEHRGFYFHNGETSAAIVNGFTIKNGYKLSGGAICCSDGSSPTITNNIIINNQDPNGGGGAVSCSYSDPIISGNVLSGNSADDGGAISLVYSNATISHNIIFRNSTPNEGGALSVWFSSPLMESNTIVCNSSGYGGGGMFLYNSSPTLVNCIVAFNNGIGGMFCSASGTENNPVLSCCDIYGNEIGDWSWCIADQAEINGNMSIDPLFCDTLVNDFHLNSYSPCNSLNNSCGVLIGSLDVGCCCIVRGDVVSPPDGIVLVNDLIFLVEYLFKSGDAPECLDAGDCAQPLDGIILVNDLIFLVDYLFKQGPAPSDC